MNRKTVMAALATAGVLAGGAATVATATGASAATAQVMSAKLPAAPDHLTLTFDGSQYTYTVHLHETWAGPGVEDVSGTLTDPYLPGTLAVHGEVFGKDAVISVDYGNGSPQSVRTFAGKVGIGGHVTGNYSELGTEGASGSFALDRI